MVSSLLVHFGGDRQEKCPRLTKRPVNQGGSNLWFRGFTGGSPLNCIQIVVPMNPCPCGYFGSTQRACRCTPPEIRRYLDRVSGPLLDRIDIQIEVDSVPVSSITGSGAAESSAAVAARVAAARSVQYARYSGTSLFCNAQLDSSSIRKFCVPDAEGSRLLHAAADSMHMSMRAYHRILKVARTIADLAGEETISSVHIAEAVQYRELDQKYWR